MGLKEEIKNVQEEQVVGMHLEVERNRQEVVLEKMLDLQAAMKIRRILEMKIGVNTKFASFIFMNFLSSLKIHRFSYQIYLEILIPLFKTI